MYYVYVIQSLKDGKNYTGMTIDLIKRLREHNIGKNKSTKFRGPFKLVYKEKVNDRESARKREKFLKSGSGREFLKNILT